MKRIATTVCATVFAVSMGSAIAQDNEPRLELASKIVPVEMYACQYNDGQGPSDLDKAVESFTDYMDENDVDNYAAWTLSKVYSGPAQEFDFLWLGAWTDGNAMGTGTDRLYATGGEMLGEFAKVAQCGAHVARASINYKLPEGGTPASGVMTFSNCNIEEGQSYPAIAEATRTWAGILADAGSQAAIYHWFPIFGPGGDSPDFTIIQSYPNHTELGADVERRTNGELFRDSNRLFGDLMDCDVARVYNATNRRAAKLR